MSLKTKVTRELMKATSDKTDFNKAVFKLKKHFGEAGKVINGNKKK